MAPKQWNEPCITAAKGLKAFRVSKGKHNAKRARAVAFAAGVEGAPREVFTAEDHEQATTRADAVYDEVAKKYQKDSLANAAKQRCSPRVHFAHATSLVQVLLHLLLAADTATMALPWDPVWLGFQPGQADASTSSAIRAAFGQLDRSAFAGLLSQQAAIYEPRLQHATAAELELIHSEADEIFTIWQAQQVCAC